MERFSPQFVSPSNEIKNKFHSGYLPSYALFKIYNLSRDLFLFFFIVYLPPLYPPSFFVEILN